MREFQLAPVIDLQLPVYGIKEAGDTANDIFPLNTDLIVQRKFMRIGDMGMQLYLVKQGVCLKSGQILSGIAVDKGTLALQHLLFQIPTKGILSLMHRIVGEREGLRL